MRKIGAYFLGVFLLLLLGAALIHPSLLVIADWLGPAFGPQVYGAMTMAFIMLGDPIGFPVILLIWVFVALLIGGIVRRRLGAVLVALLVWLTMLPITASIAFALAQTVPAAMQGANSALGGLPPLPSGMTITSIFEAPIAGKIIKAALTAMSGDVDGGALVGQIMGGLVVDLALKPVILVAGALIGVELGRFIQKRRFSGAQPAPKETAVKVGAVLLIACLCSTILLPSVSGVQFGDEAYTEAMVGALDKNGRTYVGDLFMDTSSSLQGMGLSASDADGLAVALVVSQSGVVEEFQKRLASDSSFGEMSSMINLLPPTFGVVAYIGVSKNVAAQRSVGVSRILSSMYGVDLSQVTSFSIQPSEDPTGSTPMISLALYQSSSDIGVLADNYLSPFEGRGGFIDAIKGAVDNGRLVPGKTGDSATGAVFAAGFVNVDVIKQYFPEEEIPAEVKSTLGAFLSGTVSFAGGASFWTHGAQPSGSPGGLNLLNLLGEGATPTYSSSSDLSVLLTFTPPGENIGGTDVPNVKISTNVPLTQDELNSIYSALEDMGYIVDVKQGAPSPSDFQIDTTDLTLPLNVEVTKTIIGGDTSTVTVTIQNKDTKPMTDVTIDDGSTLAGYTTGAELVSGSTTGAWDVIPPGESRTITYMVRMDNPGVYTLEPANLSYTDNGVRFSDSSNVVETAANRPFALFVPFELAALIWQTGSQLLDIATGRGVIIMSVITLAFVALIAWDGFKTYKKYSRRGEASEAPRSVSGDKSEAPQ